MSNLTLNDIATIVGLVAGVSGLVIGILNFLRDKPKVLIELQWDMSSYGITGIEGNELVGIIRVANTGRRPIYVSHVAIKLPPGYENSHLVISEGLVGKKLQEGDQPLTYPVIQNNLEEYKEKWRNLTAQISDSTGKVWRSKKIQEGKAPSWAL